MKKNNYTEELRQSAVSIKEELIKAYTENMLPEYINERALSVEKDEDNEITHILFTQLSHINPSSFWV